MERYVDTFVRENPRKDNESEADYLERFFKWMVKRGAMWPDTANDVRDQLSLEAVEAYIRHLPMSSLSDDEVTLVVGNIRGFAHELRAHLPEK